MYKCIEDFNFNITYNFYDNIIYIKPLNDKFEKVLVDIMDQNRSSIYSEIIDSHKELTYWFKLSIPFTDFYYIHVEISDSTGVLTKESIKIRTKSGIIIKPVILNIENKIGLGDQMHLSPSIRKLYNIYGRKIIISSKKENYEWGNYLYSSYKEFLKNNRYVNYFIFTEDIDDREKYDIFDAYNTGDDYVWIDQRKLVSVPFNFILKDDELFLDYIPDKYIPIENLPFEYVCINPYITGIERMWEKEKWQELVNLLNDKGIPVVSIGKFNYFNLDIKIGLDLAGKDLDMSQTWHLINMSKLFVTFDCGMYILSHTTNTHVLQIGWYADNKLHGPLNKNVKYSYITGECDIACSTNIDQVLEYYGTIKNNIQQPSCILNKNYSCKPTSKKVFDEIEKILLKNIKFTIITPTYKRPYSLKRCIDSVINQTYENFEMLICSDGHDVSVKNTIETYNDDRLKYSYVEQINDTGTTQRNLSIRNAVGDYIMYIDDDNIIYENCLDTIKNNIRHDTGMIIFKTFNCLVNGIIPNNKEIRHGNIDSLSVAIKRKIASENKWKNIYEHDYLFIKDCEKIINEKELKINYLENILGEHLESIESKNNRI
jgi:hypothetical protein